MTPEAAAYLRKARALLAKAPAMLANGWPDDSGRAAYLAGFHAAQALIFERQGRSPKTHGGVQSEFARLVRDDPRFDLEQRRFLARAYNLKAAADYETGPDLPVTPEQATDATEAATRFLTTITLLLS